MNVSRRDVVVAGAVAFGTSGLLLSSSVGAQGGDEAAVAQNVEILRKAQLEADRAKLAEVTSETRKQVVKSITFPDLKLSVVGNAAIVRHIYVSESELDGKATTTRIGALQVWQKHDGAWKLLARQGFRLPA